MQNSAEIQTILDNMQAITGCDIVSVHNSESSMLNEQMRLHVLKRYHTSLKPHYEKKFKELGGTDGVLQDLENYIVECINDLENSKTQGEAARIDFTNRREISGSLGKYHTALRALLDNHTLITWESVLHKGSTVFFDVDLREFLAYHWLAASDTEMEIIENFKKEIKTPEDYKNILDASKTCFVSVLQEIRRAHNEGILVDSLLDNPSCIPGTFGRIAIRSSIYNKLTAFSSPAFTRIPHEIENFIVDTLSHANDHTKLASFDYINNKILELDGKEKDKETYFTFLNEIYSQNSKQNLFSYLEANSCVLFSDKNGQALKNEVIKIFNIILRNIKLDTSNALPNCNFVDRLLKIGLQTKKHHQLTETLSPIVIQYRLKLRQLHHIIKVIERLVDNELIRGLLVPTYSYSTKYIEKMQSLEKYLSEYQNILHELHKQLNSMVEEKITSVETHITQETSHKVKISDKEAQIAVDSNFSKSTRVRLENLQTMIFNLCDKFKGKQENLPTAPGQRKIAYAEKTTDQWAYNIIRVASETECNGQLVNDERELQRLATLMNLNLTHDDRLQVLRKINELLVNPKIIQIDKKKLIKEVINESFKKNELDIDANDVQSHENVIVYLKEFIEVNAVKFPEIFSQDMRIIANTQLFRSADETFDEEKYSLWKKQAFAILEDKVTVNLEKFKSFIILSIFANLKITEITLSNIQAIEWLCDLYLGLKPQDKSLSALPFKVNVDLDLRTRIDFLTGHLSCLLTSLKNIFNLFNAGHVCLMSREIAQRKLKTSCEKDPYIIRLSNSAPTTLVISHGHNSHNYLDNLGILKESFDIEGVRFTFDLLTSNALVNYIKSNPKLVTPIGGLISLEEASKQTYMKLIRCDYERICSFSENIKNTTQNFEQQIYKKISPNIQPATLLSTHDSFTFLTTILTKDSFTENNLQDPDKDEKLVVPLTNKSPGDTSLSTESDFTASEQNSDEPALKYLRYN